MKVNFQQGFLTKSYWSRRFWQESPHIRTHKSVSTAESLVLALSSFRIHWTGLFLAYQLPAFEKDVEKPHLICGIMDLAGKIDMHDMKWIPIGR
ncbi:hypothetical protein QL285_009496 [Trifolium repens]|nr:hypothetical protein QL285_009496 [Trifolium repens]